jgi:hypothetical protein
MTVYNQIKNPSSKPKPTSIRVYPYGSVHPLNIAGIAAIDVQAFGHQRTLDFIVSTDKGVALLGREAATELDRLHMGPPPDVRSLNVVGQHSVNTNPPNLPDPATSKETASPPSQMAEHLLPEHLKTNNILSRYSKVFEGLGRVKNIQIEIYMKKKVIPVVHPPSRVPVHLREALDKELDLQEALGIIEPAVGPTPWVSRMVIVQKTTSGQVRIMQDWRDVNANVEREIHPIPPFEEATDEMDGATVWSKLDLYKSFHQLPLHPNSRKYATFSTLRGLRRCTTVVMGFCNASAILQRTMNMVLSGLPGVKWIHDDITVYGKTMREHNE